MTPKTKVCAKCGQEKTTEQFNMLRRFSFRQNKILVGKVSQCKQCLKQYKKKFQQENKERLNAISREYNKTHKAELATCKKEKNKRRKEMGLPSEWQLKTPAEREAKKKSAAAGRQRKKVREHQEFIDKIQKQKEEHQVGIVASENFNKSYVTGLLTRNSILTAYDIPEELKDAKREHLKLQRLLRRKA